MIRTLLRTRARALLSAAALCAVLVGVSPMALAQTNVVGSIAGTDVDPGSQVTVTNTGTGATRSATADSTGRFQVSALPPGVYDVELSTGGRSVARTDGVLVTIGGVTMVSFGARELEEVVVSGQRVDIDVTSTDTRTVFTADQLQNMTVGVQLEEVTLLAPGTVRGDSRYTTDRGRNAISFGGSGANENAYYINGYAVTDPLKGLGSSSLPFNSIDQIQLLTGGYGAEFGRSTGGVVNIVTKSGTNNWLAGATVSYAPAGLEGTRKDSYYPNNGTASDGILWSENSRRSIQSTVYSGYVGGPIVQDKLFIYLSGELEKRPDRGPRPIRNTTGTQATQGTDGWFDRKYDLPRWLAKIDWNIAEGHSLEFTGISDVQKQHREYYGYYYISPNAESLPVSTVGTTRNGGYDYKDGGETYIAKYTGTLTENLIFTGLYGRAKNIHRELPIGYDPDQVPIRDNRNVANPFNIGPITLLRDTGAYDKTDGFRLDLEWLLGRHDMRLGYDLQNQTVRDGDVSAGPGQYIWLYDNSPEDPIPGSGGASNPGGNGDYVTRTVSLKGGVFEAKQYAYFLEDRWQVNDKLLLQLGLRNENFKNYSADGTLFLNQTNQWAPRLGMSYDLFGDSRARVFANAGRYHLAIPLNLAFRQVGAATNTDEYFAFTSIDPVTGVPQGLTPLGDGPFSNNGEYGQARDPLLAAAQNLKPYFQDEFALGFEGKVFKDFVAGARFIYRKLGSQIDDICDARPAYNWAVRNGYESGIDDADIFFGIDEPNGLDDGAEHFAEQLWHCVIVNPGEANTIRFNAGTADDPDYVFAELSAEDIGLPAVKRKYMGVDLSLEHPLRNGWYGRIDWTISKSTGNAEGQLLSDLGQQDVAVTLNWDYAELMDGASGPLPNDRKHQIKAFGFYQLTEEINLSATFSAWSGRPKSPSGYYPNEGLIAIEDTAVGTCDADCFFYNYIDYGGPYYRYVNGEPSPRGSGGRLPWTTSLDLGISYSPRSLKGLDVGLDVYNVLNSQAAQNRVDYAELGGPGTPYHSTNKILSYNPPRTARFTIRYAWGQ